MRRSLIVVALGIAPFAAVDALRAPPGCPSGRMRLLNPVVAQLMGHANVDTTLNVYTQLLDGSLRAAVEKVGSELFTNRRARRRDLAEIAKDFGLPSRSSQRT